MDDSIISRTGNSKILMGPANFAEMFPTWEAFRDAFAASGVPTDILTNPSGYEKLGAPLNAATLLKNTTAALVGLDGSAVPDDMLYALAWKLMENTGNLVFLLVLDEDGAPMEGVHISGFPTADGGDLMTDGKGRALFEDFSASVEVAIYTDCLDIHSEVIKVDPDPDHFAIWKTVTLNRAKDGDVVRVVRSGDYRVDAERSAAICCIGGGQAGYSGGSTKNGIPAAGIDGGLGGAGGKISNAGTVTLTPGQEYTVLLAAGGASNGDVGGDTTFAAFSSADGDPGAAPFSDELLYPLYGGNGGKGGRTYHNNGADGERAGGGGGGAAPGTTGGSIISIPTFGGKGGSGGYDGGGGGVGYYDGGFKAVGGGGGRGGFGAGGGGGGAGYTAAAGGPGGQGVVLIQFLKEEETV